MKRALLIAIAAGSLVSSSLQAMDGVAISIAQRYAWGCDGFSAYIPEVPQSDQWFCIGNIVRYTIASNVVTARDTIYNSRRSGYAQYPTFSYDGLHVAFFRWGVYDSTGAKQGGKKDSNWIAVMDVNGSNLRNLVKISQPALNASMDWPMPKDGNWLYYIKPKTGGRQMYARACEGNELWRVNVDDPTQNAKVTTYPAGTVAAPGWERRFALSLDSKYASIQPMNAAPIFNIAMNFSLLNTNGWASCNDTVTLPGCNICVSTGGNYVAHYFNTGHRDVLMYKWNHTARALITCGVNPCFKFGIDDLPAWTNNTITFDADAGAEQIRWSVNSEKWICRWIGFWGQADAMRFGSNQLLVNWVDHQAIKTSNNPKIDSAVCNTVKWGTDAGDLWVEGPIGQIEDTTGTWHTGVINHSLRPAIGGSFSINMNPSGINIVLPDGQKHRVELVSASGAVIRAQTGFAQLSLDIAQVPAGMYLLRIDNGVLSERIPIIGH